MVQFYEIIFDHLYFSFFYLREIHLQLIKCARNTSDAYSLHIFMSVSTALFFIITVAYNVYFFLMTSIYLMQPLIFICLYWIFYFGFKIFIVSHVCAGTITEVCFYLLFFFGYKFFFSYFNEILNELLNKICVNVILNFFTCDKHRGYSL